MIEAITMPHYLLSVHTGAMDRPESMTDAQTPPSPELMATLEQELKSTGAWVFSGRLHEPDTATVVRIAGGEVVTTDGPFVESKEHLGGFYIIQAADMDAALEWATKTTRAVGMPIEVWPFAGVET
jgi:hypothetical protein